MGCDIHLHIEVKLNGNWEHWGNPNIDRDYRLFAVMAGVRNNYKIIPISEPKGLPNDLTRITQYASDYEGIDGHNYSWLNSKEIVKLEAYVRRIANKENRWWDLEAHILHSYLLGNLFGGIETYPEDRPKEITDVRFIFWFDN